MWLLIGTKDARLTKVSYSPSYTTKYLFGSQKRKVKATTQQEIYLLLVFFFMIQLFVWIPTWRVHELTLVIEHFSDNWVSALETLD